MMARQAPLTENAARMTDRTSSKDMVYSHSSRWAFLSATLYEFLEDNSQSKLTLGPRTLPATNNNLSLFLFYKLF
ncbi:hypothetical protein XENOCAPTIV_007201 [Xenoophorus captivus]|uniref:Uncharacterized protein n=1 Tax=Xenoophorus captivus TaxID=1517983 RepID=A0ABV0Q9F2_9TELE